MHQHTATTDLDGTTFTALAAEVERATTPAVTAAAGAYAVDLQRAIARVLGFKRPHDADDIAAEAVEKFLRMPAAQQHRVMVEFPSATVLARRVAKRSAYDFDRDDRIQGCRGARLFDDGEGGKRAGRTWVSGNAPFGRDDDSPSLFDLCTTGAMADIADAVIDHVSAIERLELAFAGISPADRELLYRVDGCREEIQHLAAEFKCARETMSRRINKIRAMVKANAERVKTGEMPTSTALQAPTDNDNP